MKTASPALVALINGRTFHAFTLYTITMVGGGVLRFTDCEVDILVDGALFPAQGPRLVGSSPRARWATGLGVDQWQMAVAPRRTDPFAETDWPDTIGAVPWLQAAIAGVLDNATVRVQRAYFGQVGSLDVYAERDVYATLDLFDEARSTPPAYPVPPGGAVPVGVLTIFFGIVAEVDANTTMAVLTINDARQVLDVQMPRNLYQAPCRHTLFDARCGLNAADFAKTTTVASNSTRGVVRAIVATPGGSKTWVLGRMVVTSGANAGFSRTISNWDPVARTFTLLNLFPFDFALGDALTMYPGCNKTVATCALFNNKTNFGGNPYIPSPQTTGSGV